MDVFPRAAEPQMRVTKVIHDAIIKAVAITIALGDDEGVPLQQAKKLFCRASSLVTGGVSVNVE